MTVLRLREVSVVVDGRRIVDRLDWAVAAGQHWVVLGPNGCGKTTLLRLAALQLHPSSGTVQVLGETLGRCDVRRLRRRIGWSSSALADLLRPGLRALDAVMTARNAALEAWWHTYDDADRARAAAALERTGVDHLAERSFGSLSAGERQRVLLARALLGDPGVVLLDEPTAALDLAGREDLVVTLDGLARSPGTPPMVLVTHHVEEIPPSFTHVLLLRDGRVVAAGPVERHLRAEQLSACFGRELVLERRDGRYTARAGPAMPAS